MDILISNILFVVSCVLFVFFIIKTYYYYYDDSIDKAVRYCYLSALCYFMVCLSANIVGSINKYQNKELNNIINENIVENYFIEDGYYYFELEGTDSYIKIPVDEVNIQ